MVRCSHIRTRRTSSTSSSAGTAPWSIADERRDIGPGDLVYIPPDAVHSLETLGDDPIHCFCFAVGVEGAGEIDYTIH